MWAVCRDVEVTAKECFPSVTSGHRPGSQFEHANRDTERSCKYTPVSFLLSVCYHTASQLPSRVRALTLSRVTEPNGDLFHENDSWLPNTKLQTMELLLARLKLLNLRLRHRGSIPAGRVPISARCRRLRLNLKGISPNCEADVFPFSLSG